MAIQTSNSSVTVGSSSTAVVPATSREKRVHLILTNDSNETIYLAVAAAAVLNTGIRLDPADSLIMDEEDHLNVAVNAICTSGSKNLCIYERYLDAL